jgi:hypothetical protein
MLTKHIPPGFGFDWDVVGVPAWVSDPRGHRQENSQRAEDHWGVILDYYFCTERFCGQGAGDHWGRRISHVWLTYPDLLDFNLIFPNGLNVCFLYFLL